VPFTIHEDEPATFKKANKKLSEKIAENQKPLFIKNGAKVILKLIY